MLIYTSVDSVLLSLQKRLEGLGSSGTRQEVAKAAAHAAAARFHLGDFDGPPPVVVLGGTGTGKSTIINRILDAEICAANLLRTYTAGAVAVIANSDQIPPGWLGIEHRELRPADLPARGVINLLSVVHCGQPLCSKITLVDSPDLDGNKPQHHEQADRAFRWARAVIFMVTDEKYQMTELNQYYQMARRYGLDCLFVMNKCDEQEKLEDYHDQLANRHKWPKAKLFAIPQDDSAYVSPAGADLPALREGLCNLAGMAGPDKAGLANRLRDLAGRVTDKVLDPLWEDRKIADRLLGQLQKMTVSLPSMDVSPVTDQLRQEFREKSILYLMGPNRVWDRVKSLPRLGMGTLFRRKKSEDVGKVEKPDFGRIMAEQFTILHTRLDEQLRNDEKLKLRGWIESAEDSYKQVWLVTERASEIATDELAELGRWMEQRYGGTPRDTALNKLMKHLLGGEKVSKLAEASPYLLATVVAAHGAVFGPVDLLILGIYGMGSKIMEEGFNEVAARTREASRRMSERYEKLAKEQIARLRDWLEKQAPSAETIKLLECDIKKLAVEIDILGDKK